MKTIATLLISFIISIASAQSPYEKGMTKGFDLWKNKKNDEAIQLFERIGKAEKENWIPYYYASQIHILSSFGEKDGKKVDARLKKATEYLNEAKIWSKENPEILIMEALLNTAYIAYDGAKYGMSLSPKIEMLYQKAKTIAPKNPRVVLNHTEWKMGSAKFFGKDPNVFCPDVEKAILYFENDTTDIPFYPRWGKERAEQILQNCNK